MPTAGDRRVSPPKSGSCRVAVDNREHAVLLLNHLRVFLEYSLISSDTYGSNQFVANGKADDFAEARESQFVHDVIVVAIDRPRRDAKRRGNFLVALSSGEELHDLDLSRRERRNGPRAVFAQTCDFAWPALIVRRHRKRQPV